ncbi:MAG: efflux RND transporter periplasmic adaptor subunit [Lachnospiraceae bacterium]|nr:efflux RND transporter periplasmic adaptor subunit [Lachnospiraceae bacterium]
MKQRLKKIVTNKIFIVIMAVIVIAVCVIVLLTRPAYLEADASMREMASKLEFAGDVEANETKTIYSIVTQTKVSNVAVSEGDHVEKGDVLVELDKTAITYDIKEKELALEQARLDRDNTLESQQSELEQLDKELKSGLNAEIVEKQTALHNAQSEYDTLVYKWNKAVQDYGNGLNQDLVNARNTLYSAQVAYCKAEKDGAANIETLEEELHTKEKAYDAAKKGDSDADIAAARGEYKEAKKALEEAKTRLDTELDSQQVNVNNATASLTAVDNSINEQNKEFYVFEFIKVSSALADAQASLSSTQMAMKYKKEDLERKVEAQSAATTVSQAQVALDRLKFDYDNYTITAPCSGFVSGLNIKVGDTVGTNPLMSILNYDTMKVSIDVDEYDIGRFQMNAPVKVKINSLDKTFDGKVTSIAAKAEKKNDLSFIRIEASFNPDEQISAGIGATVYTTETEDDVMLCVPSDAISYNTETGDSEVTVVENGATRQQAVIPGIEKDGYTQIIDGLSEGDTVRYLEGSNSDDESSEE